jgi:hypothetical protein
VWATFPDFYQRASEASKIVWNASRRAKRADEFRPLIGRTLQRRSCVEHEDRLNMNTD